MSPFFRLLLAALLGLPTLCLAQRITLVLTPTQPTGIAPYELRVSPALIIKDAAGKSTPLYVAPLPVDLDDDTPYEVAQRLLHELRRAARQSSTNRRFVQESAEWRTLLLPHRNLLRRKFTAGRRQARRLFLANVQSEIERQFDRFPNTFAGKACKPTLVIPGTTLPLPQPPEPEPGGLPVLLFARQSPVTTFDSTAQQADIRILDVSLTDIGANAANGERYRLCVRYSTSEGMFVSGVLSANEPNRCPPQPNSVTAYMKFAILNRALFVEKILSELQTGRLSKADATQVDYSTLVAASRKLAQAQQAAYDTEQKELELPKKLDDSLNTLRQNWESRKKFLRDSLQTKLKRQSGVDSVKNNLPPNNNYFRTLIRDSSAYQATIKKLADAQPAANEAKKNAPTKRANSFKKANDEFERIAKDAQGPVKTARKRNIILDLSPGKPNTTAVRNELENIFLEYIRQKTLLATPVAGTVNLMTSGNVYYPRITHPHGKFLLDSLEMEVEDGIMMGLKMSGRMDCPDGQEVCFETRVPIGLSADRDLNREWWHQRLWLQYPLFDHNPPHDAYVRLTDLLRYYPHLLPQGGDRSPADGVYIVRVNDPLPRRTFYKTATAKLLQARIYTDLNGFRSDNPNGLVQVEIDKKFVFGAPWSKASPSIQMQSFGYFTPFVTLSKIEQQNRYLPLSPTATPGNYTVNTIDLLRYTYLRVGGDYNLAGLRLPRFKTDFALDFGFGLNRVDIRNKNLTRLNPALTLPYAVDSTLNVGNYGFALKARIRPESRFGLYVRLGYYRYTLFNDRGNSNLRLNQLPDNEPDVTQGLLRDLWYRYRKEGVVQYEMTARFKIGENAEYFGRVQFSNLFLQSNRTFFQLQTGFQFDVFAPRREAPPGPASVFMTTVSK